MSSMAVLGPGAAAAEDGGRLPTAHSATVLSGDPLAGNSRKTFQAQFSHF